MPETDMISVGEPMPRLAAVEPANGLYTVSVIWAEGARAGQTDIIDLARIVMTYKVFKPLRDDRALFETVRLGEWGWSIVWDGHADLDISADTLADLAAEAMTNHDFVAFMKRHEWTFDVTAAQLGISRRLVAYYAKNREIPRYIMLACKSIDVATAVPAERSADLGFTGEPDPAISMACPEVAGGYAVWASIYGEENHYVEVRAPGSHSHSPRTVIVGRGHGIPVSTDNLGSGIKHGALLSPSLGAWSGLHAGKVRLKRES